ncbi:MAG: hypothetical protein AAF481_03730 [Acidobacteriota bacterium]
MRFERLIYAIALLGTAAFLAAGVVSFGVGLPLAGLEPYLFGGLMILAALLVPHFWTILYLFGTGRALAAVGITPPRLRALAAWIAATVLTLGALVGSVLQGGGAGAFPGGHLGLFVFALVLHVSSLVYGWKVLRANAALFDHPAE